MGTVVANIGIALRQRAEKGTRVGAVSASNDERRQGRIVSANPMGVRDCPAAVCGNDRRHQHWFAGMSARERRRRVGTPTAVCACEFEALLVVPGAPRPAVHRLVDWWHGCRSSLRAARRCAL